MSVPTATIELDCFWLSGSADADIERVEASKEGQVYLQT
jgi:hypothetical protein